MYIENPKNLIFNRYYEDIEKIIQTEALPGDLKTTMDRSKKKP